MDKTSISAGREAIDRELERMVPFMLERGGYIRQVSLLEGRLLSCAIWACPPDGADPVAEGDTGAVGCLGK